jgi:uncharacterized protein (UPF0218 family)
MKNFILPEKLRPALKKPWGRLFNGKRKEVKKRVEEWLKRKNFKKIICVGDLVSKDFVATTKIFDGKIQRKKVKILFNFSFKVKNQKGTIQKEVWEKIKKAIIKNKNLFIEGEEDLMVIPAVLLAPKASVVIFGLPKKGVCAIEVSKKMKERIKGLLKKFLTQNKIKKLKFEKIRK